MAQPAGYTPLMAQSADYSPVSVVSPRFCVPRTFDLVISEKIWQIIGRLDFVVKDANGNLMFKVERSSPFSFHEKKVILDADGTPIITLRGKIFSARNRWKAFRGKSTEDKDMIFSVRRSSMFQMKTKLHVFLANNVSEDVCDYTVKGSWFSGSCKVYVRDSSTMIAKVQNNSSIGSMFTGKNKFMVTVNPDIDYAFIVGLIIILDAINSSNGGGGGG